jgi:putative tryptophan/tyrosine transport system substrate-binding protein
MTIKLSIWQRVSALVIVGLLLVGVGSQLAKPTIFRIGVLNPDPPFDEMLDGFKAQMAELGYVEGQTIEYLYDGPTTHEPGKLEAAAMALMEAQVDLIFAITTPAANVAKQSVSGTNIPVVFWVIADPLAEGYVQTMQRPGGNMTGVTIGVEGIASEGRRLEWLMQVAPGIQNIYVPYNPDDPLVMEQALPTIQNVATSLDIELVLEEVHTREAAQASAENIPEDADAIYILYSDRTVMSARLAFIESAIQRQLPLSMFRSEDAGEGALVTFGTKHFPIGEQAARMADQILNGTPASEMPVEIPEVYLSINLQTASAIGLEIPDTILRQADFVIR